MFYKEIYFETYLMLFFEKNPPNSEIILHACIKIEDKLHSWVLDVYALK
jgi:hypothetical protein